MPGVREWILAGLWLTLPPVSPDNVWAKIDRHCGKWSSWARPKCASANFVSVSPIIRFFHEVSYQGPEAWCYANHVETVAEWCYWLIPWGAQPRQHVCNIETTELAACTNQQPLWLLHCCCLNHANWSVDVIFVLWFSFLPFRTMQRKYCQLLSSTSTEGLSKDGYQNWHHRFKIENR